MLTTHLVYNSYLAILAVTAFGVAIGKAPALLARDQRDSDRRASDRRSADRRQRRRPRCYEHRFGWRRTEHRRLEQRRASVALAA